MYILNTRLAADIFDDEYIIANLDTGLYYSIQGNAVSLLQSLPVQYPAVPIQQLADALPGNTNDIAAELTAIWKQLLEEGIVTDHSSLTIPANTAWLPATVYTPSRFNRYADMQDLLMLDPIHDVDEDGWSVKND